MLRCCKCGERKDEENFHLRSDRKRGYAYFCKDCAKKKRQKYSQSGRRKEVRDNWVREHPKEYHFQKTWYCMIHRCNSKDDPYYHRYGGRGIKCLWTSFEEFKKDMWQSYIEHGDEYGYGAKRTQLDRIDNDGNYCKENCRWVTAKENHPTNKLKEKN